MHELKFYRRVLCHYNEKWCKIWRGINLSVQNWHEEFVQFWLKHLKISKICTLMGCFWTKYIVFLTQNISRQQKNANPKVVLSISRRQKWDSCQQFSKNCIFPNIQLKGVVNRLPPFKYLSGHTNKFLMG